MISIADDLFQTEREHPFPGVNAHAYFLKTPGGNCLIYNTSSVKSLDSMVNEGGVDFQFISHRDEVGPSLNLIKKRFAHKLCCGKKETEFVNSHEKVDIVFDKREKHTTGIELLPTPGHTDGSFSFYYESPLGHSYLFTGDTIFQTDRGWQTYIFPGTGGNKQDLRSSLELYAQIKADYVIPSASPASSPAVFRFKGRQWKESVEAYLATMTL